MKIPFIASNRARGISRGVLTLALLSQASSLDLHAAETLAPPALEFASGLPGKQVRLTWAAQPGVRYRIEKSSTLGTWSQIALVEASTTNGVWLDPQPTTEKTFYRVMQPQPEVFSVSPPLLSPSGGVLVLRGQAIPDGSFLRLAIDGQAPLLVPLVDIGDGFWQATTSLVLFEGQVVFTRIEDGNGVTLFTIGQPITVTATGRADDSPPSTPPAMAGTEGARHNLQLGSLAAEDGRMAPGPDEDCDDADPFAPLGMAINEKGLPVEKKIKKTNTPKRPGSGGVDDDCDGFDSPVALGMAIKTKGTGAAHGFADDQSTGLIAAWASRKGYQYYMAKSDMSSARAQNNPYFSENSNQGEMPSTRRNGGYSFLRVGLKRFYSSFAPPIGVSPAPSGLPGEVSFRSCDLSLPCPAGPPLAWVCTYRSMKPISSGHGPGWDFSYNIRIDAASSTAPQVTVHDGGGRADVFLRQADGSYRCDGMFREGRFDGEVFTLTFADKGTWTFKPLGSSNDAGKISEISDRNGVGLTCAYDSSGQLETVSDEFGRSLTVEWGQSPPRVLSVTASSNLSINFEKIVMTYTPQGGKRESVSAPFIPGQAPVAGPTTYAYSSSSADPGLDDNLLSITDGAGRLMEAFTYSSSAPSDIDFDTCASHDRHKSSNAHVTLNRREIRPPGSSPASAYTVFEVDEIGRLTETDFDRLHRVVACREFTGFCTPSVPVTSSSNRPTGKLRDSDPAYFETTCAYNADSLCTRITRPDGGQELVTYDRDFRQNCPVRERANPRVITLVTPGPIIESRAVTLDYQPGFGTPELYLPGNPIKGMTVKGGRNPGGDIVNAVARKGWDGSVKGRMRKGWDGSVKGNLRKGWDGSVKGRLVKEEGGRHTPFHNKSSAGISAGVIAGIVVAAVCAADVDEDCDGRDDDCDGFVTRMVSAHGQVSTFGYDTKGNCTSYISSLPNRGSLYQYDAMGRCTRSTTLNGQGSSFIDDFAYGTDGFLSSVTSDSAGLHLTTSFGRDAQGRVTGVTDPRGSEWRYAYNPLHQCIQMSSPLMPSGTAVDPPYRVTTDFTIDNGGRIVRCDTAHLRPNGSPDPVNPVYSTYFIRDERAGLIQVAREQRPMAAQINFTPESFRNENFDVCDITYDAAGQVSRLSTPAACRAQAVDRACDFTYNERGLLHRCIDGGLGTSGAVTTGYEYDPAGAMTRCATILSAGVASPQTLVSYDGFHRLSSITDPMGNVAEYAYGNDGSVLTSFHGEVDDVPGQVDNVLLARTRTIRRAGMVDDRSAFFDVETEDDTITEERFSPGDTGQHATETTVVNRSPAGLVQTVTRNGDLLLSCTYDTAGRRTGISNDAMAVSFQLDPMGQATTTGERYDFRAGPPVSKMFTRNHVYDALGRLVSESDSVGNTTTIAWDSLGRPVSVTFPGGRISRFEYDGGDPASPFSTRASTDLDGDGTADIVASSDSRSGEARSATDALGHVTTLSRDALGRMVRCDHPDGTYQTQSHDSRGFPDVDRFRDGTTRDQDCDLNGRVISRSLQNEPAGVVSVPDTTCSHDGLGRVRHCQQGAYVVTLSHDSLGNRLRETQDAKDVFSTYDVRGRTSLRTSVQAPYQLYQVEERDGLGRLLSISDATDSTASSPVVSFNHLGALVSKATLGNGVTSHFEFRGDGDEAQPGTTDFSFGRSVRLSVTDSGSNVLLDSVCSRDRNQNSVLQTTLLGNDPTGSRRIKSLTRDSLGRETACVITRHGAPGVPPVTELDVAYTLDARGDRTVVVGGAHPGVYAQNTADAARGRYSSWPEGPLEWDANGNLAVASRAPAGSTHGYHYDALGRLVSVTDETGSTLVQCAYDGFDRLVSVDTPAARPMRSVSLFLYDEKTCVQELSAGGDAAMNFITSGGSIFSMKSAGGVIRYPTVVTPVCGDAFNWPTLPAIPAEMKDIVVEDPVLTLKSSRPPRLITDVDGHVIELQDCDDAARPAFLDPSGLPTSAGLSVTGLRWLSPACAWEPEIGMFACPGSVYSPDLGTVISDQKDKPRKKDYVGHITLMK